MKRVVITGAGIVSTLGDSPTRVHHALCKGQSGLRTIEGFVTNKTDCRLGGQIMDFNAQKYLGNKNLRPLNRASQLSTSAAHLALEDSGWSSEMRQKNEIGIALGTMFCSIQTIAEFDHRALVSGPSCASPMDFANTVINAAAGQTAIMHNLRGINSTISTGATSGLRAIGYATGCIQMGYAPALLAGGVEEFCFASYYAFNQAGLLGHSDTNAVDFPKPFDFQRNGVVLGEGAALLMLEDAELAQKRGARILAEIKGYGIGYDCSRGFAEEKATAAIARAMRQALQEAEITAHEVDCLSASANGSRAKDRLEAMAINGVYNGSSEQLPITAVKSMLGETLGAAGAMQVVDMLETIRDGVLPGIAHLNRIEEGLPLKNISSRTRTIDAKTAQINSVGFEGNHCSLILSRFS